MTGADRIRAKSLLDATNGNIQLAIEMHFDSGASEEQANASSSSRADSSGQAVDGAVCSSSSLSSDLPHSSNAR